MSVSLFIRINWWLPLFWCLGPWRGLGGSKIPEKMSYSPFTDVSDIPSPSIAQMRWREDIVSCIVKIQNKFQDIVFRYNYIKEVLTRPDRCINRMDTFHSFYAFCRRLHHKEEGALQIYEKSNIQINCLFQWSWGIQLCATKARIISQSGWN